MTRVLLLIFFWMSGFPAYAFPQISEKGFTSAKVCGECHESIYEGWKGSMHANSVNDPIFYPIFLETSRQTGGKSDLYCLSCHAPTTRITKDTRLTSPLTEEGVTCDFCHSVREVSLKSNEKFQLQVGRTKWGPLKGVTSPVHATAYSPVYEKSEFCGGCHEFSNEKGVAILETYSEWLASPQAKEGKNCQECHMPKVEGLVVPPKIQPTREVYIHSHEAAGGHSVEQVKKAVEMKLGDVIRDGEKIHAVVRLKNVGSGHKVPTGIPSRKLVLRLTAHSGGTPLYTTERVYQKVLLNQKGEPITKDADLFLAAEKIGSDNRLEPGKTREEHFDFLAPTGRPLEVEAEVFYLYQPRLIQETEMKVELGREVRSIQ